MWGSSFIGFIINLLVSCIATGTAGAAPLTFELETGHSGQKVTLATSFEGWNPNARPTIEARPGFYVTSFESPWLPRFEYKFVVDDRWAEGPNSVIELPFREDPRLSRNEDMPEWILKTLHLTDWHGHTRTVWVLEPPAQIIQRPQAFLYFLDGGDYLERTGIAHLLENLSSNPELPLFTAVLIPPHDRTAEYGLGPETEALVEFLAHSVRPTVESGLAVSQRLLVGASLGGVAALVAGIRHPDIFSWIAPQSGAFWWKKEEIQKIVGESESVPRLSIFLEHGIYEGQALMAANEELNTLLTSRGAKLTYRKYPSTHDWIAWRNRLGEILEWFFSTRHVCERQLKNP